jgi:hypothetical protein
MHSVYLVLVKKSDAENEKEAEGEAVGILDKENFAGECGFFGSSKADWYEVGGRWRDLIALSKVPREDQDALNNFFCDCENENDKFDFAKTKQARDVTESVKGWYEELPVATTFDWNFLSYLRGKKGGYSESEIFDVNGYTELPVSDKTWNKYAHEEKYWVVVIDYHQ